MKPDLLRVVAGAILHNGQVLAARRGPTMKLAGQWELPGGKVEPGESDQQALARELHEELGVHVHVHELLGEAHNAQILLVCYAVTLREGTPTASEHDALAWLDASTLHSVDWAQADLDLLPPLHARLVQGPPA